MPPKPKNRSKEYAKRKQERVLDKLAEFEEFTHAILPKLRAMLKDGASADEILSFSQAAAAARVVTIAATEIDSSKALAASKDILDRTQGKATEKQEVTHRLEKLDDAQLDALLLSKLKEAGEISNDEEKDSDESSTSENH